MAFSVLPAIDVADGRLAVWSPEGARPVEAFGGDPISAARAYVATGARWAHVVDMDHAFAHGAFRTDLIRAVATEGLAVQASGGIVDPATVDAVLSAGALRVVLASAVLADEARTVSILGAVPPASLLVGLECRDGRIVARGRGDVDLELASTLGWLAAAGAPGFLVTAVTRVGSLAGPDVATIRRVTRSGRPTIAAGGISSLEHLRRIRSAGAVGAVVGRAALDGHLALADALAWGARS